MKTRKNAIWLGLYLLSTSAFAQSGSGSHGGDEVELEAWSYARAAGFMLQSNVNLFEEVSIQQADLFYEIMNSRNSPVTVEATDDILKDDLGRIRTAINVPSKNLVRINRQRWREIETDASRFGIVGHEFTSAVGSPIDRKYSFSSQLRENYQLLYENGNPVFFGGIYHQAMCNSRQVHERLEYDLFSPEFGNIMIKSNNNGSYHLYIDGVFKSDCRGAQRREHPELTQDLIANETLIANAAPGVVQLLVYDAAVSQKNIKEHSVGSCGYTQGKVFSRLVGGDVIYEHIDNPNDTELEKLFKRTLATSNHLQSAVRSGQCTIPFFPGKKLWLNQRLILEKKRVKDLGGRVGYYDAVKRGETSIDLSYTRGNPMEGMIVGQWKSEDFRRSGVLPNNSYLLNSSGQHSQSTQYTYTLVREYLLPIGFTPDEIVSAFRSEEAYRMRGLLSPHLEENEARGMTFAVFHKNGILLKDLLQNWSFRSGACLGIADHFEVCMAKKLAEVVVKGYPLDRIFNGLEKEDFIRNNMKKLLLGLIAIGVPIEHILPKTDIGLNLIIESYTHALYHNRQNQNHSQNQYPVISLASFKHLFDYRMFLKINYFSYLCEPQEFNNQSNYYRCTHLKELFSGHTEDLAWLNEAKVPLLEMLKGLGANHVMDQKSTDDLLLLYLAGAGVKLPVIKKFAEVNGVTQESNAVRFLSAFLYGYAEAAVKSGGAGCVELKWMGYDRKAIRETGVCR